MMKLVRPGFVLAFLLSCTPSAQSKTLNVVVIDTGFCVSQLPVKEGVTVRPAVDITASLKEDTCALKAGHPRLHGQEVLKVFLKNLDKISVTVHPLAVFDAQGFQSMAAWQKALQTANQLKADLILTASGFPHRTKQPSYPPVTITTFVPAGRVEQPITADTILYPQLMAPEENLLVIAHFDGRLDPYILYKNVVDFYQPGHTEGSSLRGSSLAVAIGAAKGLNLCAPEGMKACLKKHSRLWDEKTKLPTF